MPENRDVLILFILLMPDKFQTCFMHNEKNIWNIPLRRKWFGIRSFVPASFPGADMRAFLHGFQKNNRSK